MISVEPHPALVPGLFVTTLPHPVGEMQSPPWLKELLDVEASAPVTRTERMRQQVRDLLRHGGYKPTGRGKPASEYLVKAAADHRLVSINAVVDVCNAVSMHSGLPISLVDADRAEPPLRIAIPQADVRYVFNAAGQEIRVRGLVCLHDAHGPCANGVKDSERTKTRASTTRTITVVWGCTDLAEHTEQAVRWYRELLARLGASTELLPVQPADHAAP